MRITLQFKIEKQITSAELGKHLGLQVIGDEGVTIAEIGDLSSEGRHVLKFSNKKVEEKQSGIVIAPEGSNAECLLQTTSPRLDFCRALTVLIEQGVLVKSNSESTIAETAQIAASAVIEDGVSIGENTIVEQNVTIHSGVVIGNNCIIRANTVIGAQGFGFEKSSDGSWVRFPHLGGVVIGDNVEIGALNSVCIGALNDTVISDGVKTDNLVHIAHNCVIGKNSILTACTELSGGVVLGEEVWMGPNSSTKQKITIADRATVGLGTVVTKNVAEDKVVAGVPAKVLR